MSGGVDSSVTAALLKERGFQVIGLTMRLLGAAPAVDKGCCGGPDMRDAKRVAEQLGIAHHILDFELEFEEEVMRPFAAAYARGETPSPCIDCNQHLKFRHLLATARDLGAHTLATGHYAQRFDGPFGPELHQGADPARDQSYFLFALDQEILKSLIFPLGAFSKAQVRLQAQRLGLHLAAKPDSQDICFVSPEGYAALVGQYQPSALVPGEIIDTSGAVLGQHRGLAHYTVGQRRGLGLGGGPPLYVLSLDAKANRVVVGLKEALGQSEIRLRDLHWLAPDRVENPVSAHFRIRSSRPPVPGRLWHRDGGAGLVELESPEEGVARGQACVAYDGTRLLGGGWIA
ncbi:MAG: tRNA 2-thiouridine(34) synthase MnmA [Alphaproteobacteria bacterium]|nr:tRNA 2-thiouridine(34) synthase MnmA [Alphaproteobacteria bacterium]